MSKNTHATTKECVRACVCVQPQLERCLLIILQQLQSLFLGSPAIIDKKLGTEKLKPNATDSSVSHRYILDFLLRPTWQWTFALLTVQYSNLHTNVYQFFISFRIVFSFSLGFSLLYGTTS